MKLIFFLIVSPESPDLKYLLFELLHELGYNGKSAKNKTSALWKYIHRNPGLSFSFFIYIFCL